MTEAENKGTENPHRHEATDNASTIRNLNRSVGLVYLAGLVVTVMAFMDTFNGATDGVGKLTTWIKELPEPLRWTLLGITLALSLWSLYLELQHRQDLRTSRRLSREPAQPPDGYFRIGPYLARDRDRFRRADQAQVEVLHWLTTTHEVPLYLTGDSGSGKSSLLNAAVLPELRDLGWQITSARADRDPEAALRQALVAGRTRPPKDDKTLRDLAEAITAKSRAPLLLLLDQFEEFLILGDADAHARFAAWMTSLRDRPVENLHVLLVLRSDYQRDLGKCGLPDPHYGRNLQEIGRFDLSEAKRFMQGAGLPLDEDQLQRLLDSAAALDNTPGRIRPITLNVLGQILLQGRHERIGVDAGWLIRDYLARTLDQTGVREAALPVINQLVTEQGTKRPQQTLESLAAATGLATHAILAVLNALMKAGLARSFEEPAALWELSHDFVARAIHAYLGRRAGELRRRALGYAGPALLAGTLAALGVYEKAVAEPERERRRPILPEMVDIPDGSFCMGSRQHPDESVPPECAQRLADPEAQADEGPVHRVNIPQPFQLGKFEVTIAEYERFALDTGRSRPGDSGFGDELKPEERGRLPAINVSFDDAQAYAAWLSSRTGEKYRLPTEAEWEYAARAGTDTRRPWGDDKDHDQACEFANVLDEEARKALIEKKYPITWPGHPCTEHPKAFVFTAPVGQFKPIRWPNGSELYDMLGNVWEWVADCYHDDYRGAPTDSAAWSEGAKCASGRRVLRGGSWNDVPDFVRSAGRNWNHPGQPERQLRFSSSQDLMTLCALFFYPLQGFQGAAAPWRFFFRDGGRHGRGDLATRSAGGGSLRSVTVAIPERLPTPPMQVPPSASHRSAQTSGARHPEGSGKMCPQVLRAFKPCRARAGSGVKEVLPLGIGRTGVPRCAKSQ